MRQTLTHYGVPLELYTDRAGLFFVITKKSENWTLEEQLAGKTLDKTQFGAILDRLGINLIGAHSPQAKGRVERLWGTLQDRLPTHFKLNTIANMEQFNAAAVQIMDWFNRHFAVEPESTETSFVPLSDHDDLDTLLAVKHERTTDACGCFSFQKLKFEIIADKCIAKKKVVFIFSERIGFRALYNKVLYPVKPLNYLNDNKHLPEVTKALLHTHYLADGKTIPQP
jgi:hypothetical protein